MSLLRILTLFSAALTGLLVGIAVIRLSSGDVYEELSQASNMLNHHRDEHARGSV